MRSKRMQPVANLAEQKEQDAVRDFVTAQDKLMAAELQLQQLLGYRKEYENRLHASQAGGIGVQRIRDFFSFLQKLDLTINQAHLEIDSCKQLCEQKKQVWLSCRSRSQALDLVVEKYRMEEFRQQERVEQKEQDEHAQRIAASSQSKKT